MAHANARLTPAGRLILCQRIAAGRPPAHVAAEMGISRTTAYRWWARYRQHGQAGLHDRPSTAHRHPHQVPATVEAEICRLRRQRKLGPARIAPLVGRPASTAHRVLVGHGLNQLAAMDRPTGRVTAARSAPDPASWSTWMSRSWGTSPTVVAIAPTAAPPAPHGVEGSLR